MQRATKQSKNRLKADKYLWGLYILLLIFSVVELYSASSTEVKVDNVYFPLISHCTFLFLGLACVLLLQNIHYKWYRKTAWFWTAMSLGLVIYSNLFGLNINGAMRAISVAGFTIQPAEIAKLAVVLVLARILSKYQMRHGVTNRGIITALIVLAVFCGLLYKNGFTNTALLGCVALAMFVIGGVQGKKLLIIFLGVAAIGGLIALTKFSADEAAETEAGMTPQVTAMEDPHAVNRDGLRKGRVDAYLAGVKPTDSVTDENRQVIFAKIAQAHGGLIGNGPGNSRESARLPLAYSDYIYSIIVEDTGFIGGIILLVLYLLLVARAGFIATKCTKAFPALLIMGCATLIVTQALIHMAIVTGLGPVSGQPLPFISKGGTSVVVMSCAMGMMLSVSKFAVQARRQGDADQALKEAVADPTDQSQNPTQLTYSSIE